MVKHTCIIRKNRIYFRKVKQEEVKHQKTEDIHYEDRDITY